MRADVVPPPGPGKEADPDEALIRIVGKTLAEVDRAVRAGACRHRLERRGRRIGEDRVHARRIRPPGEVWA